MAQVRLVWLAVLDSKTTENACLCSVFRCGPVWPGKHVSLPCSWRMPNNTHAHTNTLAHVQRYWTLKSEVIVREQVLLRVLGFDVDAAHPHSFLVHILNELEVSWL